MPRNLLWSGFQFISEYGVQSNNSSPAARFTYSIAGRTHLPLFSVCETTGGLTIESMSA
jgi:hypothetical protein